MKRLIYADNAATTKLDIDAFEAMKPYLLDEYGNASQPYSFARTPKTALKEARAIIASCINAKPEEIFFTSGGTESDNWAVKGVAFAADSKRATITSAIEHHAVLRACEAIERLGYPVVYINPNTQGFITETELSSVITPSTRLVSVMLSNNEIGTIQPIRELAKIAHDNGALFHTDAVQGLGHIPIDVCELGVDLLSASAHKFNGPKGVGFLYIKQGTSIAPLMDGGSQEGNHRAGTENVAAIVGMAVALKKNCDNLYDNMSKVKALEEKLLACLEENKVQFLRNGRGNTVPGNLSLSLPGYEGESILHRLDLMGIQISTGSACDSVDTKISHVLQAIQAEEAVAKGTIRISLGKDNTDDEIQMIADAIVKVTRK